MSDNLPSTISQEYGLEKMGEMRGVIRANVGNGDLTMRSLQQVHVPNGGMSFALETLDGEESVKTVTGIIVGWTEQRRYYAGAYNPGDAAAPPDCSSVDLIHGEGEPGGLCKNCPFNQWGTSTMPDGSPGKGKACSQYRHLLLQRPGMVLPTVINVPPTSLKAVQAYFLRLAAYGKTYYSVVTEIGLEKGQPVSTMTFKTTGTIDRADIEMIAGYLADMNALFLEQNETEGTAGE